MVRVWDGDGLRGRWPLGLQADQREEADVVCCSQRGGTRLGLESFWPGWKPRGFRLPPRSPPRSQCPSQMGLIPLRLRVGASSRALLLAPRLTTVAPDRPAQDWADSSMDNPEKRLCLLGRLLAPSRKQRRLRPGWLLSWSGGAGGGRGSGGARVWPTSSQAASQQSAPQNLGQALRDLRMLTLRVPNNCAAEREPVPFQAIRRNRFCLPSVPADLPSGCAGHSPALAATS